MFAVDATDGFADIYVEEARAAAQMEAQLSSG